MVGDSNKRAVRCRLILISLINNGSSSIAFGNLTFLEKILQDSRLCVPASRRVCPFGAITYKDLAAIEYAVSFF